MSTESKIKDYSVAISEESPWTPSKGWPTHKSWPAECCDLIKRIGFTDATKSSRAVILGVRSAVFQFMTLHGLTEDTKARIRSPYPREHAELQLWFAVVFGGNVRRKNVKRAIDRIGGLGQVQGLQHSMRAAIHPGKPARLWKIETQGVDPDVAAGVLSIVALEKLVSSEEGGAVEQVVG